MHSDSTAQGTPADDAGALLERIRQLGDDVLRYRAAGDHDAANAAEVERDTLRRHLAKIALAFHIPTETERAPATARGQIGVPAAELVNLIAAVGEALDTRNPDAREWTASVIEAFLMGRQDAAFAAGFLRAQAARIRAAGAPFPPCPDPA